LIWDLLRLWISRCAQPDPAVAHSVRLIDAAHGCGPVEAFAPPGLGTRQWQRRFVRSSGFTPKAFARITRFQHLIGLYQSAQRKRWADLALEAGFYDQAHLVNEFRTFSGKSPEAYFQAGRGMAEFYRDGFFQDERKGPA
jgi:methylphosphotriester-DNA--protein-cysteine methyltransferase